MKKSIIWSKNRIVLRWNNLVYVSTNKCMFTTLLLDFWNVFSKGEWWFFFRLEWPAKQGCPLGSFAYSVPVPCSNINNMNYYNLDDCDDCWLMHHRRWFPILMIDIAQSGHHLLYLSLTKYTKAVYTKLQCPQHTENLKVPTFPRYLRMMFVIADDDGRWWERKESLQFYIYKIPINRPCGRYVI